MNGVGFGKRVALSWGGWCLSLDLGFQLLGLCEDGLDEEGGRFWIARNPGERTVLMRYVDDNYEQVEGI